VVGLRPTPLKHLHLARPSSHPVLLVVVLRPTPRKHDNLAKPNCISKVPREMLAEVWRLMALPRAGAPQPQEPQTCLIFSISFSSFSLGVFCSLPFWLESSARMALSPRKPATRAQLQAPTSTAKLHCTKKAHTACRPVSPTPALPKLTSISQEAMHPT